MNILIDFYFNSLIIYYYCFLQIGSGENVVRNRIRKVLCFKSDANKNNYFVQSLTVAYPKVNMAFSVSPVTAAAIARIKVVKPNEA